MRPSVVWGERPMAELAMASRSTCGKLEQPARNAVHTTTGHAIVHRGALRMHVVRIGMNRATCMAKSRWRQERTRSAARERVGFVPRTLNIRVHHGVSDPPH